MDYRSARIQKRGKLSSDDEEDDDDDRNTKSRTHRSKGSKQEKKSKKKKSKSSKAEEEEDEVKEDKASKKDATPNKDKEETLDSQYQSVRTDSNLKNKKNKFDISLRKASFRMKDLENSNGISVPKL